MFANNPMGLVVKGMMEELREEGEIPASRWQDWVRDHASRVAHVFDHGREQKADISEPTDLQPCESYN